MAGMMTKTELAVRTVVSQELFLGGAMEVSLGKTFEELEADSLDRLHLHLRLEDAFGIEIPWEEGEKMRTVGDIVNWLLERSKVA